jgi:hypothetical protein
LGIGDGNSFEIAFLRSVNDTSMPSDKTHKTGAFIRELYSAVCGSGEAGHSVDYLRIRKDKARCKAEAIRSLFLFVRIASAICTRDFILKRFLRAKDELVLKSVITRELEIESRIK